MEVEVAMTIEKEVEGKEEEEEGEKNEEKEVKP